MPHPKDFIRDAQGATYRIGTLLGRGLFAKTYTVRTEDGTDRILKISLGPSDFSDDKQHLVKISRGIMDEQWQMLSRRPSPHVLAPIHNFISEDGRYCLIYPRNDHSIRQYLGQMRSLQELFRWIIRCAQNLSQLPSGLFPHGNLHPNNIFWDGKNLQFMDPLTPLLRLHHADLLHAKGLSPYTPPEYRHSKNRKSTWEAQTVTDTYALCLLFVGRILRGVEEELTTTGWNKLLENNLGQSLENLLRENPSTNAHFHDRVLRQTLRLLDRGLHLSPSPSPPYRFDNILDFQRRIQSILDLSNPTVSKVGTILFGGPLGKGEFQQGEDIHFSCSIHTTPQLEDHEDITCGTILVDLHRNNDIVEGYDLWVEVSRLHGGRLRFQFGLHGVPPGNYGLFLGFRVQGSVATPKQVYAELNVIAAAGYAPETPVVPPKTLQFPTTLPQNSTTSDNDDIEPQNIGTSEKVQSHDTASSDSNPSNNPLQEQAYRHPLLKNKPRKEKGHTTNKAIIKVPNLQANRLQMVIPENEFSPPRNPLENFTATLRPKTTKSTLTKQKPLLTVLPDPEPQKIAVGSFHQSPFTVQLDTLFEAKPVQRQESHSQQFDGGLSEDDLTMESHEEFQEEDSHSIQRVEYTEVSEYTDGFSEGIQFGEPESESEEPLSLNPPPSQPSVHKLEPEEVQDIVSAGFKQLVGYIQRDPFTATIVGLVGLILFLGLIILVL